MDRGPHHHHRHGGLGRRTAGRRLCSLSGGTLNNVHIGRYSSIAAGTIIGVHEHPTSWLTTSRTSYWPQVYGWDELIAPDRAAEIRAGKRPFTRSCPITEIGHDVWIGQGCFIKSGVRIGHGSVIGARATVTKDVPPIRSCWARPGAWYGPACPSP